MDLARQLGYYSMEDIDNLPDGQRAELMDGQMYMMATPSTKHQRLSGYLYHEIYDYIRRKRGDCEPFAAPFAVYLYADDSTYLEPDISVVCDRGKLTEKGCNGAPDWVIEIVSPDSRTMDYYRKLMKYSSAGVREYWIVDQDKNRVMVYNFEHDTLEEYAFSDKMKAGIYEDLEIGLSGMSFS